MIDSKHAKTFQRLYVTPVARQFHKMGILPNYVTLSALIAGLFAAILVALNHPFLSVLSLLMSGFLDNLDGCLARVSQKTSHQGAALDIISDRIVEFSLIFGLYLFGSENRAEASLLMLGGVLLCVTSFLVVGIFESNSSAKSFHYSTGLIERTEAFTFFTLMILVPSIFFPLAFTFSALTFYTAGRRIWEFYFKSVRNGVPPN
jgi:archaetidylinositol phosphate synthase